MYQICDIHDAKKRVTSPVFSKLVSNGIHRRWINYFYCLINSTLKLFPASGFVTISDRYTMLANIGYHPQLNYSHARFQTPEKN